MKSIKEKAQEWAYMYPSCGMADKSFKAGANYVLDEVECILLDKELDCEEKCDQLIALIEQLKK